MTVEKIATEPISYHFRIDDEIELFLTEIEPEEWLCHDLKSYADDSFLLYAFLKESVRWFDNNLVGHISADITDSRFLRLFNSMGFGITKIYVRRPKQNEEKSS